MIRRAFSRASNTCLPHGVLYSGSAILPDPVTGQGTSPDSCLSIPQGGSRPNVNPFGVRCMESGAVISPRQGLGRMPAYWNAQMLPYIGVIQTLQYQSSQGNTPLATDKAEVDSSFLRSVGRVIPSNPSTPPESLPAVWLSSSKW